MLRTFAHASLVLFLVTFCAARAYAAHVTGEVTRVDKENIAATFPVPVKRGSMMTVMTGEGEAVAGLAVSRDCRGSEPPYDVDGTLYLTMDAVGLTAGKKVYVNSVNTLPAQSPAPKPSPTGAPRRPAAIRDLGLYYYAAGQKVSYGALGLGYERTIRLTRGFAIEVDGGVTGVGSVSSARSDIVNTQQLIKNAIGRVRFDFSGSLGFYSAYRWNEARGSAERWETIENEFGGKQFIAPSELEAGTIQARGIEYGVSMRPVKWLGLCAGFIPEYRSDYGSFGVRSEPAYTGEMRLGFRRGGLRLRGLYSDGYWTGDMGITLR